MLLARTGWSAEIGYEVYLRDSTRGDELWEAIMSAGAAYGIAPASPSRIRRIEAGILDYRVDIDLQTNPYEIGLGRLVNLDTADDFVGKSALQQIQANGVQRNLVGVEIGGETDRRQFYRMVAEAFPARDSSAGGFASMPSQSGRP